MLYMCTEKKNVSLCSVEFLAASKPGCYSQGGQDLRVRAMFTEDGKYYTSSKGQLRLCYCDYVCAMEEINSN